MPRMSAAKSGNTPEIVDIQPLPPSSEKDVDATSDDTEKGEDNEEDDRDYPSTVRLDLLTTGIAVVVSCVGVLPQSLLANIRYR